MTQSVLELRRSPALNVRAIEDRQLGGIIVPFGSVDKLRTFWDRNSNFMLRMFEKRPMLRLHLLDKKGQLDGWVKGGVVLDDSFEIRAEGLYARVRLDDNQLADEEYARAMRNEIAWSTGAVNHLVEIEDNGYVRTWGFVELSTGTHEQVVSQRGKTVVEVVRAVYENRVGQEAEMPQEIVENAVGRDEFDNFVTDVTNEFQAVNTGIGQVLDVVRALQAPENPGLDLPEGNALDNPDPIRAEVHELNAWDEVDLFTQLLAHRVMQSKSTPGASQQLMSDRKFRGSMAEKIEKIYHEQQTTTRARVFPDWQQNLQSVPLDKIAVRALIPVFGHHIRANEAMSLADSGMTDLVDTLFDSTALHYFRTKSAVFGNLPVHVMTSPQEKVTVVTSGPTWFKTPEPEDATNLNFAGSTIPQSKVGLDDVDFSTQVVGARTFASFRLFEEIMIDLAQVWAQEYLRSGADAIDYVLINGDERNTDDNISWWTTGSGTTDIPGDTTDGTDKVLVANGLRYMSLTANANAVNINGALDSADIVLARRALGTRGDMGQELGQLLFVADPDCYYEIELLSDYKSMDDVGSLATLVNGPMSTWRRVPVVMASANAYPLTDVNGRIDAGGSNTKCSGLLIYRPMVHVGVFRRMRTKMAETADGLMSQIASTFRVDIQQMQPDAVAYTRNITVS